MSMTPQSFELEEEATKIGPILSNCSSLYHSGRISAFDFVGIFILTYLGLRRPRSWSNGRLKYPLSSTLRRGIAFAGNLPPSTELSSISGLLDILDRGYVAKRMNREAEETGDSERFSRITILSIFDNLQLRGIKKNADNYVNKCLVSWAYGQRPCLLMFRVPSPLEVLQQQSEGSRVITMFLTKKQLGTRHTAMLYYMAGMQNHSKDSLEFLLHDMKHMENFIDSSTHNEQVGFFKCIMKLSKLKMHEVNNKCGISATSSIIKVSPLVCDGLLSIDATVAKHATVRNGRNVNRCNGSNDRDSSDTSNSSNSSRRCSSSSSSSNDNSSSGSSGSNKARICTLGGDDDCNLIAAQTHLVDDTAALSFERTLPTFSPHTTNNESPSPKKFFLDICGYDKQLWRELEYVISDM